MELKAVYDPLLCLAGLAVLALSVWLAVDRRREFCKILCLMFCWLGCGSFVSPLFYAFLKNQSLMVLQLDEWLVAWQIFSGCHGFLPGLMAFYTFYGSYVADFDTVWRHVVDYPFQDNGLALKISKSDGPWVKKIRKLLEKMRLVVFGDEPPNTHTLGMFAVGVFVNSHALEAVLCIQAHRLKNESSTRSEGVCDLRWSLGVWFLAFVIGFALPLPILGGFQLWKNERMPVPAAALLCAFVLLPAQPFTGVCLRLCLIAFVWSAGRWSRHAHGVGMENPFGLASSTWLRCTALAPGAMVMLVVGAVGSGESLDRFAESGLEVYGLLFAMAACCTVSWQALCSLAWAGSPLHKSAPDKVLDVKSVISMFLSLALGCAVATLVDVAVGSEPSRNSLWPILCLLGKNLVVGAWYTYVALLISFLLVPPGNFPVEERFCTAAALVLCSYITSMVHRTGLAQAQDSEQKANLYDIIDPRPWFASDLTSHLRIALKGVLLAALPSLLALHLHEVRLWEFTWQHTDAPQPAPMSRGRPVEEYSQKVFGQRMKYLFLSADGGPLGTPMMLCKVRWWLRSMGLLPLSMYGCFTGLRKPFSFPKECQHFSLQVPLSRVDRLWRPAVLVCVVQMMLTILAWLGPEVLGEPYAHFEQTDVADDVKTHSSEVLGDWWAHDGAGLTRPVVEVGRESVGDVQRWIHGISWLYITASATNLATCAIVAALWRCTGLFGLTAIFFQAFTIYVDTDVLVRKVIIARATSGILSEAAFQAVSSAAGAAIFIKLVDCCQLVMWNWKEKRNQVIVLLLIRQLLPSSAHLLAVSSVNMRASIMNDSYLAENGIRNKLAVVLTATIAVMAAELSWPSALAWFVQLLLTTKNTADGHSLRLLRMTAIADAFKHQEEKGQAAGQTIIEVELAAKWTHQVAGRNIEAVLQGTAEHREGNWRLHIMPWEVRRGVCRREKRVGFRLEPINEPSDGLWYAWTLEIEGFRRWCKTSSSDVVETTFTQKLACESVSGSEQSQLEEAMVCLQDPIIDEVEHVRGPGCLLSHNDDDDVKCAVDDGTFDHCETLEVHKLTVKLLVCAQRYRTPTFCEEYSLCSEYEARAREEGYEDVVEEFDTPRELYKRCFGEDLAAPDAYTLLPP